jgi:ElaB/YqjD/DUF883 family membrane-anchored ribosome-binding protein
MTQQNIPPPDVVLAQEPADVPRQGDLQSELQALIGDAEKLLHHAAGLAGDQADELRSHIKTNLQRARDTLGSGEDAIRQHADEIQRASASYIQKNPLQALGIAAGIGVLIGLLLGQRHHDE